MSDAKKIDERQALWLDELDALQAKDQKNITKALAASLSETLRDLRKSYSKFVDSDGANQKYSVQQQTAKYRELLRASETLLSPSTLKNVQAIYKRDLKDAYAMGGNASNDLAKLVETADKSKQAQVSKMPLAAQSAAGERLQAFWEKERAALRTKVTQATLNALQTGKGWKGAQAAIADALRTSGQTILRSNDELSVTARGGIVMNLEQRANLIARTELASAYVQGQMNQARKNGYTHGRWSATGERTCPFCAAREGAIYTLDDLANAIPAHPRCRCTVIPVDGDAVKRAEGYKDQAVGAAAELDDAGWTAIRQQRINEYLKYSGKPSLDASKYLNTPTNTEKFFGGPNAEAVKPSWIPSGSPTPDLKAAQKAAEQAEKIEEDEIDKADLEAQQRELEKAEKAKAKQLEKEKAEKEAQKKAEKEKAAKEKAEKEKAKPALTGDDKLLADAQEVLKKLSKKVLEGKKLTGADQAKLEKASATKRSIEEKRASKSKAAAKEKAPETTDDIEYFYDDNDYKALGYKSKKDMTAALDSVVKYTDAGYRDIIATQFKAGQSKGAKLTAYEQNKADTLAKTKSAKQQQELTKQVEQIEDFISRAPKYDGFVQRGMYLSGKEEAKAFIKYIDQGNPSNGMESWTTDYNVASDFASGRKGMTGIILNLKNENGAPISGASEFSSESEVLIPSGQKYRVVNINERKVRDPKTGKSDQVIYDVDIELI